MRKKHIYHTTHMRQAAMLEPVGDPFGGPAYGQRNGPALALVSAGASIWAGMAIPGMLGGLMIAGGVMSGLGAITGNKTLSTLGMVAGLAGGVGQFVQSGAFESVMSGDFSGAGDQFMGGAGATPAGGEGIEMMYGGAEAVTEPVTGLVNSPSVGSKILSGTYNAGAAMDAATPSMPYNAGAAMDAATATAGTGGGGLVDSAKNFFSGDMAKFGAIQAAGGFLKGLGEGDVADKKLELDEKRLENEQALVDKKLAGVPMASIGSFGTNKNAAVFGKNADGSPATREQYINAWRSYYPQTPATTTGAPA